LGKRNIYALWPSGEAGAGSIPARYTGDMLLTSESLVQITKTSVGVKISKEADMKTCRNIQRTCTTMNLSLILKLKLGIIVAAVAGCLLAGQRGTLVK